MLANYHTHTRRCQHASGEDREYVEAAIAAGYRVLGFADHCPWVFGDGYISGIRMAPSQTDGYFYSLEALRKEYAADIKIYIGFEAEYLPWMMEKQEELLSGYPVDYLLLGQHFLGEEADNVYMSHKTEDEERLKTYVDRILAGMETGKYLYPAHPDLINFAGPAEVYQKHMRRLCEGIKAHDVPLEINLLGLAEGRRYPNPLFWEVAGKVGNKVILGVDAHSPEQLLNKEVVCRGKQLAEQFSLRLTEEDLLK